MPPPSISATAAVNENAAAAQRHSTSSSSHFPENQTESKVVVAAAVSGSLKRKRPPTIQIPNVLREIRVDTNLAPKDDAVCFSGPGVGVFSRKGKKKFMEDTHKIVSSSHGVKSFFGVYDGHGGRKAAEFVAENLHANIFKMLETCTGNSGKEEAVKAGYLRTDQDFLKQFFAEGGVAEALTRDHRAGEEDERKRIESKGGYVENHRGAWRVHGVLSVSRSIGDSHLKDWVVAEADTTTLYLTPDMEYLVLASDGLWEEVGNQEAVDTVIRSCLIEKKLGLINRDQDENGDRFGFINRSTSSMLQRISPAKKKKKTGFWPSQKKIASGKEGDDVFSCEDESPRPPKIGRISFQTSTKIQSPNQKKKTASVKKGETVFSCENESPHPPKTRRISFETSTEVQSPNQKCSSYKKRSASSSGLVAACNELVNLAVARGSFDDITVMIIDLNHFK
ncbi:protein-serine,threonine phosphatase [Sarracenia purpurea var. burkii]